MTEEIRVEDYLNLMRRIAWSFHFTSGLPYEDLLSSAFIAFEHAKRFYNPEKAKFSTFYYHVAKNHLIQNCVESNGFYEAKIGNWRRGTRENQNDLHPPYLYEDEVALHQENQETDPEKLISLKETLMNMRREAREVCEIVFESPHEFIVQGRPKLSQGRLRDGLRERGWSWPKIRNGMREVKQTLTEMA